MFSFNKKLDANLKAIMAISPYKNHRVLIKYSNFPDSIIKKVKSYKGITIRQIDSCEIICASLNSKSIERLLEFPEIKYICLDEYLFLCGMSVLSANKVRFKNDTHLSGKGVGIGIIDTGVYPHKDLTLPKGRIYTFYDLINSLSYPYDDNGHGTSVCGVIAGNGESSNGVYKGIASEANLHVFKAFDKLGKGFVSDVLFALQELISLSDENNIKVLCLPFELLNFNSFIYNSFNILFKIAKDASIVTVLPTGSKKNDDGSLTGLSLSTNCLTISGLDTIKEIKPYTYSSSGNGKKDSKPDFSAACVDIVSLNCNTSYISEKNNSKIYAPKLDTSYKTFSGTSLAAAFISGVCAILYEKNPNLTFNDVFALLKLGAEPLNFESNKQGAGKININKLLD